MSEKPNPGSGDHAACPNSDGNGGHLGSGSSGWASLLSAGYLAWLSSRPQFLGTCEPPPELSEWKWDQIRLGRRRAQPHELELIAAHAGRDIILASLEWETWWAFKPLTKTKKGCSFDEKEADAITKRLLGYREGEHQPSEGGSSADGPQSDAVSEKIWHHPSSDRAIGDW